MYGKWCGLAMLTLALVAGGCVDRNSPLVKAQSGMYVSGAMPTPEGEWEFVELLGLDKWGPILNFHDNPALNGDPVLVLNNQGLFYKGQIVCPWRGGRYEREQSFNMVLENCPPGLPITSALGGRGTGDARVIVAIFGRQPNGLAETTFSGQVLYTFLGAEGNNWRPAPPPGM
jgi:hypothetical protein